MAEIGSQQEKLRNSLQVGPVRTEQLLPGAIVAILGSPHQYLKAHLHRFRSPRLHRKAAGTRVEPFPPMLHRGGAKLAPSSESSHKKPDANKNAQFQMPGMEFGCFLFAFGELRDNLVDA
jgi:hypothetical protein